MCELLALSSSASSRLTFSLHTLAGRGGLDGRSHDGWGVAFYEGNDVALFREPDPAAGSALVRHLEAQGPATRLAISHIRHATRGGISLANTQPFVRELGGRTHVFAHNGDLPGIEGSDALRPGTYRRIGQTDSEQAFCVLLARMAALWRDAMPPSLERRLSTLAAFAAELRALGPANFLYADSDALFAHGDRRLQRNARAEPPGLWMRRRTCAHPQASVEQGAGVAVSATASSVLWVASVPLTDDAWEPLARGDLVAVRGGAVAAHLRANGTLEPDAKPTRA